MDKILIDQKYADMAATFAGAAAQYTVNIAAAVAILILGSIIAGWAQRRVRAGLSKIRGLNDTLEPFIAKLVKYAILLVVLVAVLAQFGVQTTSIIAILGAAGLAIGLALQGTLANIASGVMLLFLRPFENDDYITAGDVEGTVKEIGVFVTQLETVDGLFVMAPNSQIWNQTIVNQTRLPTRRYALRVGIGYNDDIDKALDILVDLAKADERILDSPRPRAFVRGLDDNAVTLEARVWATQADFWNMQRDYMKAVKEALDKAKISIPYPQRDVHLYEVKAS